MTRDLGLEEALDIAMDAELRARDYYAQAATSIQDPQGRDLLGRLASFEQYHYDHLARLVRSLGETGQYIAYSTKTVVDFQPSGGPLPFSETATAGGEAAGSRPEDMKSAATVLSKAIENEKVAGERYRALAMETDDDKGQDMFKKLADEEMIHQRILEDEFFSLSNKGTWGWSGMYGE